MCVISWLQDYWLEIGVKTQERQGGYSKIFAMSLIILVAFLAYGRTINWVFLGCILSTFVRLIGVVLLTMCKKNKGKQNEK